MSDDDKTNGKKRSVASTDSDRLRSFLQEKIVESKKVAIFTHPTPDPDSIASFVALRHLLQQSYDLEVECFYEGEISHPQNKTAVQLLDPDMRKVKNYHPDEYCLNILVDAIPTNAGMGCHEIKFDLVIDHHKDLPGEDFAGLCIHHHSGSCIGIIYGMIRDHKLEWDSEDESTGQVASAILVGVITDTDFCTKPDTTIRDFRAQQDMFPLADADMVRKIVRFKWPMSWVKLQGLAITEHKVEEGVAVVGLGMLSGDQKDAVAAISDHMLTWGNIQTAVVFALFDGEYISGSVRTVNPAIEVHTICETLGGQYGRGGGKSFAGGYWKPLGAFEFESEEDPGVADRWWKLQKDREAGKIFKLLNK